MFGSTFGAVKIDYRGVKLTFHILSCFK